MVMTKDEIRTMVQEFLSTESFKNKLKTLDITSDDIILVALIGSYQRGFVKDTSDIDLVFYINKPLDEQRNYFLFGNTFSYNGKEVQILLKSINKFFRWYRNAWECSGYYKLGILDNNIMYLNNNYSSQVSQLKVILQSLELERITMYSLFDSLVLAEYRELLKKDEIDIHAEHKLLDDLITCYERYVFNKDYTCTYFHDHLYLSEEVKCQLRDVLNYIEDNPFDYVEIVECANKKIKEIFLGGS